MMLDDGQVLLGLTISADEFRRTALGLNRNTPIRPGELRVKIGNMSFLILLQVLERNQSKQRRKLGLSVRFKTNASGHERRRENRCGRLQRARSY